MEKEKERESWDCIDVYESKRGKGKDERMGYTVDAADEHEDGVGRDEDDVAYGRGKLLLTAKLTPSRPTGQCGRSVHTLTPLPCWRMLGREALESLKYLKSGETNGPIL